MPGQRRRHLDALLPKFHELWHAQPFRELRPNWCARWPALSTELLALDDATTAYLNDDAGAALALLARHLPAVGELALLGELPLWPATEASEASERWAWEIPGRKRSQIEAFAAATHSAAVPVLDWCGGKGHLGRLLGLRWGVPVTTLEIDPALSIEGEALARRLSLEQDFVVADALSAEPPCGSHAVALHACGELHRGLIVRGVIAGVVRFDIVPCCYHRGVSDFYEPLSAGLQTRLTRDDTRLAVT
jgi:hypothetical protein